MTTTRAWTLKQRPQGMPTQADFELKAASVENPYNLQMFKRFTCPQQI